MVVEIDKYDFTGKWGRIVLVSNEIADQQRVKSLGSIDTIVGSVANEGGLLVMKELIFVHCISFHAYVLAVLFAIFGSRVSGLGS